MFREHERATRLPSDSGCQRPCALVYAGQKASRRTIGPVAVGLRLFLLAWLPAGSIFIASGSLPKDESPHWMAGAGISPRDFPGRTGWCSATSPRVWHGDTGLSQWGRGVVECGGTQVCREILIPLSDELFHTSSDRCRRTKLRRTGGRTAGNVLQTHAGTLIRYRQMQKSGRKSGRCGRSGPDFSA